MLINSLQPAANRDKIIAAAERLFRDNYSRQLEGCLPSRTQSIVDIHPYIKELMSKKQKVIVFAFDALSFDFFSKHLLPHVSDLSKVTPLTSVFPSTTASAWPSMLTGQWPVDHGIYGTSFKLEGVNRNYIWISNTLNEGNLRLTADLDIPLCLSQTPTLFTDFKSQGWQSYYNGNHGQGVRNPFRSLLTKDTQHFVPVDYATLKYQPQLLVDCFVDQTKSILANDDIRKKLIWNYYDLDDYIHGNGYEALANGVDWRRFFEAWTQFKSEETAILLVSDHGQTLQHTCTINWLNLTNGHPWFEADTGGAGRILYFYPKAEYFNVARKWIEKNMGNTAILMTREEAFSCGLFTKYIDQARGVDRIGGLIAIARNGMFISAGSDYVSEHGALTKEEMIVPFVVEGGLV